jgi:hypothetical protein
MDTVRKTKQLLLVISRAATVIVLVIEKSRCLQKSVGHAAKRLLRSDRQDSAARCECDHEHRFAEHEHEGYTTQYSTQHALAKNGTAK